MPEMMAVVEGTSVGRGRGERVDDGGVDSSK